MGKKCGKCGITKPVGQFYVRKAGTRTGELYEKCIDCMKLRGRQYYHTNHARQLALAIVRRNKARSAKRDYIYSIKSVPCADCGIRYDHYVMDLDHKDRQQKIHDVTYMVQRNWSLEKIKNEIEKCDVVCANCHRIRTFGKQAEVAKVVTAGL